MNNSKTKNEELNTYHSDSDLLDRDRITKLIKNINKIKNYCSSIVALGTLVLKTKIMSLNLSPSQH